MTTQEMINERLNGKTYREIAEMCGMSRQNVHSRIKHLVKGRFHRIIYKGIYDYFADNKNETLRSFAEKINQNETVVCYRILIDFIYGRRNTISINAIKKICEVVNKPFEEAFKERAKNEKMRKMRCKISCMRQSCIWRKSVQKKNM